MKKQFDFQRYCNDHGIPTVTTGKHSRPGWVQIECPFCSGNTGHHLGFKIASSDWLCCWRCGGKSVFQFVEKTGRVASKRDVFTKIEEYTGGVIIRSKPIKRRAKVIRTPVELPYSCGPLKKSHKQYLRSRGLDPAFLAEHYNVMGTGPLGEYKRRIIAPVYHKGRMVSYQGRDVTGKSPLPYKACAQDNERRDHKHCLYGLPHPDYDNQIVIVEGIFDVWKLGFGAMATFGIKFKHAQVKLISKYENAFILYDSGTASKIERQAAEQAERLQISLSLLGCNAEIVELDYGDPGELSSNDAQAVMSDLGFK